MVTLGFARPGVRMRTSLKRSDHHHAGRSDQRLNQSELDKRERAIYMPPDPQYIFDTLPCRHRL
jgi:hypothetical protein